MDSEVSETVPRRALGYGAAAVALSLMLTFAFSAPQVLSGELVLFGWNWAPSLGISLDFQIDGLSLIFSLLISGIGAMIFLYATGYMGCLLYTSDAADE